MPKGESKSSRRRIEAKERQRDALTLRKSGATFEDIAGRLGYHSRQAAFDAVTRALRAMPVEGVAELRQLDIARLDKMLEMAWPYVMEPTVRAALVDGHLAVQLWDEGKFYAIDRCIKILAQRAKLLGLEMPAIVYQRVDHSGNITIDHRQALLDSVATIAVRAGADGGTAIPNGRPS